MLPLTGESYYTTDIEDAVKLIEADDEDTIIVSEAAEKQYTLKSKTLYDLTKEKEGFRIAEDVNVVLTQTVKNKETTDYYTGVNSLKSVLDDLNEADNGKNSYQFNAVIEDGRATSVIIIDNNKDTAYEGPDGTETETDPSKVSVTLDDYTIYTVRLAGATTRDEAQAIEAALTKAGYTDVKITVDNTNKITDVKAKDGNIEVSFELINADDAGTSVKVPATVSDLKGAFTTNTVDTILLGEGTYDLGSDVLMIGGAAGETNGNNRELTIIGVPGKTVIKSSNSWAINANGNNLTVNIEGVTFEGNGSNMAIQDQYHDRYTGMTFKINNCTFKNYGYAVQLIHAGEGSYVTNCTFENNTVGVSIGAADGTVVLSGNTYKGNSKADITYFGTDTEIARVDVQDKAAKVEKDG